MTASELLPRLERVRKSRRGWSARCPAHEDKHNSLSVAEDDSRVLLHCFAGCPVECIVAALGLEMSDLFAEPPNDGAGSVAGRIVSIYDYVDDTENLLYQVLRYEPKNFKFRRPNGN